MAEEGMSKMGLAATITIFFMTMGYTVVTPAMAVLGEAFPDEQYTMISTLPNLFIVISGFIVGAVAGRRVKFRTLAILGSVLTMVGGVAPAWLDSFALILVCRAVFGLGLGLTIPLANALVIGIYSGDRQSALLGYGSMFMKAGGIMFQMVGGWFADISWQMTFYAYFLYAGSIVMALFIPEPNTSAPAGSGSIRGIQMDRIIWVIGFLMLLFNMQHTLVMLNVSSIFVDRDVGGATVAATALSINSIIGVTGGLAFGKFFSRSKRLWLPLLYLLTSFGAFMLAYSESAILMTVGICLCGLGFGLCVPTFMAWVSKLSNKSNFVAGTSITQALMYLGAFLASYWLIVVEGVTGDGLYMPLWIECVICAVLVLAFIVYNPFKSNGEVQQAESA